MSITIKSDQLNILIYKYLQQCNLSHTAYTLFHESNLSESLSKYKFDVKAGQLVSLIEKALLFSHIQSHITMNQYEECQEGFFLLKPHVCKIVQKAKQEKEGMLKQLTEGVYNAIKRTNSVHNTLYPNRDYEQIIYQQRSGNFFDKLPLKLSNSSQLRIKQSHNFNENDPHFCAYDGQTSTFTLMSKKDNYLSIYSILPCKGQVLCFQMIDDMLVVVHEGNQCQIIRIMSEQEKKNGKGGKDQRSQDNIVFRLGFSNSKGQSSNRNCNLIKVNKKMKNLVVFQTEISYIGINLKTMRQIVKGQGIFQWTDYSEYLVLMPQQHTIKKHSLGSQQIKQFECPLAHPSKLRISQSQIYFSVQSITENTVLAYNFDQKQPLYIFNLNKNACVNQSRTPQRQGQPEGETQQQLEELQQVLWVTSNDADNLVLVTDTSIKVFQVDFNSFSKVIEISSYDRQIRQSCVLYKDRQNMYVVSLGEENLIVYDVGLGKIQRVQDIQQFSINSMFELCSYDYVGLVGSDRILMIGHSDVAPLFL